MAITTITITITTDRLLRPITDRIMGRITADQITADRITVLLITAQITGLLTTTRTITDNSIDEMMQT